MESFESGWVCQLGEGLRNNKVRGCTSAGSGSSAKVNLSRVGQMGVKRVVGCASTYDVIWASIILY